ncbi:MAG: nitroreductase family protein [Paludibacter sp.]|nr:nitroreductase family protein [Bacteroidales bacterium]MCM1069408.1 nitroreductase family protein [Prevotella sp.]MCM1353783.1 nitroreductase family protein [Bacteroides sp.]MCM1442816.1 nitroreductase family protein [Muribaculum sp.]MCM1481818.1 nitroreductase family protein [Paludibacter sp.]
MDYATRRTIRKYTHEDIPASLLNEMLSLAARTSNTGNMQTYSVVVTRSAEQKAALAPSHFNQPMLTNAPVVLTFCADYNRFCKWCEQREAVPGYDNFQSFIGAAIDTCLFAQTFANIAEERGLGLCYLGTTTYNAADIIRVLKLPKRVVPVCTITLGYPAEKPELQDRLPLQAILHEETYHNYTAQDIDRFYKEKEALPSSERFIQENGKQTLAQVFTDIRYTRQNCEVFSEAFLQVLRDQLFL